MKLKREVPRLLLLFVLTWAAGLKAQTVDIEAVPDRPTFSSTAHTVQKGVFELEYGLEVAQGHQDINGLLKFGLSKNLEIRFANNPVERDAGITGTGDSGAGCKLRLFEDKRALPAISFLYTLTIPTATSNLGVGAAGHSFGLLLSKDISGHHLDFNESIQWLPQSAGGEFEHNYFTAIAYSHPITKKLGFSEEIAGFSRTGTSAGTLTILQALTYNASRRLVLDWGFYVAARGNLPRATFFAGITYAVDDLYRHLKKVTP